MVDGIRSGGAGRSAIEAQLKRMQERSRELGTSMAGGELGAGAAGAAEPGATGFAEVLSEGLGTVESKVDRTNEIHFDVLQGRLDIHEVAAQIKESELTFQFALQVRNKLMDAYREVMRMSV